MTVQPNNVVLAVTGASGSAYAMRLAQVVLHSGLSLHLVISNAARQVMQRELEQQPPGAGASAVEWLTFLQQALHQGPAAEWGFSHITAQEISAALSPDLAVVATTSLPTTSLPTTSLPTTSLLAVERIRVHGTADYSAGIASGSFRTRGMVICPCSLGTLSSIAAGASTNLIQRAADVHLKERRPLIVVPRETPLGMIALENMVRLTQAGATVLPAMPGFYHQPRQIADLVDFIVARLCDHLQIRHSLTQRWGE